MSNAEQLPTTQKSPPVNEADYMALRLRGLRFLRLSFLYGSLLVLLILYYLTQYVDKMVNIDPVFVLPRSQIVNETNDKVKTLADDWLRVNKARVDWRSMLRPCLGNIAWRSRRPGFEPKMKTSANESYIKNMIIRPAGEFTKIFLQTRTIDGVEKRVGGDFWRVVFQGPSNVHATVFDYGDGSYEAMVLLVEPGQYSVVAILEYTLCEGIKDPPEDWFRVGNAQGKYQPNGILNVNNSAYIYEQLQNAKNISVKILPRYLMGSTKNDFQKLPCNVKCSSLSYGHGRWVEDKWKPYIDSGRNRDNDETRSVSVAKRLGTLWIYGDSLAVRLHISLSTKPLCQNLFTWCQRSYNWLYPLPDENEYVGKTRNDDFDFRPKIVLDSIRYVLRHSDMKSNESLLVLNLGLHFPISINFTSYQELIRDVITMLKSREQLLGTKAKVIWKTNSAIHKENSKKDSGDNWRFFTTQRILLFDKFAMSAMCEAGIDVIDIYHLTASYPHGTTDVVHYNDDVFSSAELEIERYAKGGLGNNVQKFCIG